jgi:tight adherence protein B
MALVPLTFVFVLFVILGAYVAFVVRPEGDERSKLLTRLGRFRATERSVKAEGLERHPDRLSDVQAVQSMLSRAKGLSDPLERFVTQSGLNITVGTLVMASVLVSAVGYLIVEWFTHYTYVGLAAAPVAGSTPFLIVRVVRGKRFARFEEQFPEAIAMIARALRAGHTFPTGLLMAAEEIPNPVGDEFKLVYDRQKFGMPFGDALKSLAERVPILDVKFFATAVITQRETGGNLSEVLDNLAAVIRERFKVRRHIRAVSAHGRISGWVLAGLPPALTLIISITSPGYMKAMFTDPLGIRMLVVGASMQVIGSLVIRKLVDIRY